MIRLGKIKRMFIGRTGMETEIVSFCILLSFLNSIDWYFILYFVNDRGK